MRRIAIIANPSAGAHLFRAVSIGQANRQRQIEAAVLDFERRHYHVELFTESSSRAAENRAAKCLNGSFDTIVAAGGDGTVNAVVNGMMQGAGSTPSALQGVALGVLPLGTGNVFAYNMGIDKQRREACRIIRKGHTRSIDLGLAKHVGRSTQRSRYFLLMTGIGYDAKVIEDVGLRLKYVLRDFAYVLKTLENVVRHQGTQVTLTLQEAGEKQTKLYANIAWLVMVGNAASYAWNIKVTPHARLDDGLLDVCLMPYENKLNSVQQALQILMGQHIERGIAQYWQVQSVRVESSPNVPVQLDGDEWSSTPVELGVIPGVLRVLVSDESPPQLPLS